MRWLLAPWLGVLSFGVGCSRDRPSSEGHADGSTNAALVGSCDRVASMSVCSEYAGGHLAQNEAVVASSCAKLGGTFAHAECPNTAVLGSCRLPSTTGETRKFYASGAVAHTLTSASRECSSYNGLWTVK